MVKGNSALRFLAIPMRALDSPPLPPPPLPQGGGGLTNFTHDHTVACAAVIGLDWIGKLYFNS